jgi:hypothetical protein
VDAVGGNHDVGLGGGAVGEFDAGHFVVLLEADGTVAGMDDAGGQVGSEEIDEVGAVHAEGGVPAGGVRHLHRGDRRAVVAKVAGARADARAPFLDGGPRPTRSRWRTAFGVTNTPAPISPSADACS